VSLTAARTDAPPAPQPAEVEAPPPAGAVAAGSDLASRARADGIEFIMALFVDLTGKPCAKLVPIEAVEELQTDGVGFAGYAVGAMGQEPKDPDLIALPDPTSYMPVLFIRPGLEIVHCDPHVEGHPWPYAPRIILEAQLARAAELGLELKVGAEVEYSPRCRRP
jgi:glutamine synthetase